MAVALANVACEGTVVVLGVESQGWREVQGSLLSLLVFSKESVSVAVQDVSAGRALSQLTAACHPLPLLCLIHSLSGDAASQAHGRGCSL